MAESENTIELNISYHPTPYPHAMRQDIEDIAEVCDGIYMPFAESDLAYMSNKIKYCIDIAHDFGLIVLADFWGYGNLFACGAIPSLMTIQHPELNCVTNTGRAIPKSCPNKRAFRKLMKDAVEDFIERYNPDGVFWDEPGWYLAGYLGRLEKDEWLCRCKDCQAKFRRQFGKTMPVKRTKEVEAFQNASMLDFLGDLCKYVKDCGDHLVTSTCVMPTDSASFKEAVAKTENLDIFGIDPYWVPEVKMSQKNYIKQHTGEAVRIARANGKLVEAWVCAWKQKARREADAYRAAKLNAAHDLDYISAWSYLDYVSWVQCDAPNQADPELVWKNLRQAYHEIREGDLEIRL